VSHRLVVNIHRGERYDVYIGRSVGARCGPWGNPFIIGIHGNREQVLAQYRDWLPKQAELMRRLPELKGKVLGCFCAPAACHGDILAELANRGTEGQTSLFGEAQ
jgi:hypothetical protein